MIALILAVLAGGPDYHGRVERADVWARTLFVSITGPGAVGMDDPSYGALPVPELRYDVIRLTSRTWLCTPDGRTVDLADVAAAVRAGKVVPVTVYGSKRLSMTVERIEFEGPFRTPFEMKTPSPADEAWEGPDEDSP